MQIDCWNLQIEWKNLQIEGEILQIEQSNTADAAGFNRKEDKLIPVTGFGRCDV
ncbi:hypothetical protein JGK52_17230 [Cytobacillus oceanisediminis]|uniref:hypothetical protein n=1 Tax=Cytobacillus oceanisediminis TaxID=665099 RepID=UPI001D15A700|nr:hypothetical protein [Cytobacillus oceanisediminis]MCC3648409.1 hypothetical protein [Cytobacillus oceanisediminis]